MFFLAEGPTGEGAFVASPAVFVAAGVTLGAAGV